MTPEDCLEQIRIFQQKMVKGDRFPEIFFNSLLALFDVGGKRIKSCRQCFCCKGWGLTRHGGCGACGYLGYVVTFYR